MHLPGVSAGLMSTEAVISPGKLNKKKRQGLEAGGWLMRPVVHEASSHSRGLALIHCSGLDGGLCSTMMSVGCW